MSSPLASAIVHWQWQSIFGFRFSESDSGNANSSSGAPIDLEYGKLEAALAVEETQSPAQYQEQRIRSTREALFNQRPVLKRALDLVLVLSTAPIWFPVLALTALLVKVKLGSPVLFRQVRPGRHGQPFALFKFRTMSDGRDRDGVFLPDAVRLTAFGRWLRASSLDELPEIFNVLRGDLSLVGPRPLLMQYLDRYTPRQAKRHEVLPGVTGWAQINGRNALSWDDKLEMDVWYVENRSFRLDLKILFLTTLKVLKRNGINAPGSATASEFMGTKAVDR